jgi:hypothetical protein
VRLCSQPLRSWLGQIVGAAFLGEGKDRVPFLMGWLSFRGVGQQKTVRARSVTRGQGAVCFCGGCHAKGCARGRCVPGLVCEWVQYFLGRGVPFLACCLSLWGVGHQQLLCARSATRGQGAVHFCSGLLVSRHAGGCVYRLAGRPWVQSLVLLYVLLLALASHSSGISRPLPGSISASAIALGGRFGSMFQVVSEVSVTGLRQTGAVALNPLQPSG